MIDDLSFPILFIGVLRVLIWWAGAFYAGWRKRWLVALGLFLAGCNTVPFTMFTAGADVPSAVLDASSVAATPIVIVIVGSFIVGQPRRSGRPAQWRP